MKALDPRNHEEIKGYLVRLNEEAAREYGAQRQVMSRLLAVKLADWADKAQRQSRLSPEEAALIRAIRAL